MKAAAVFLQSVTSENVGRTGDRSWGGLQQLQLCVEDLSVSFSWHGDDGEVNIISSAVTTEARVPAHRQMGGLERTWRKSPKVIWMLHRENNVTIRSLWASCCYHRLLRAYMCSVWQVEVAGRQVATSGHPLIYHQHPQCCAAPLSRREEDLETHVQSF